MKKLMVIAVVLAALAIGTRATYAENGWATAGKVLTGFVAADILFNHVGYSAPAYAPAPDYGYGYGGGYGGGCGGGYGGGYGYGSSVGFSYAQYGRHSGFGVSYSSGAPAYYAQPVYYAAPVYYAPRYPRSYHCYPRARCW